jgi:hypothetical protein
MQTTINVIFVIAYIFPVLFMWCYIIYGTYQDKKNEHEIRKRDVLFYLLGSIIPVVNAYALVEIVKEELQ